MPASRHDAAARYYRLMKFLEELQRLQKRAARLELLSSLPPPQGQMKRLSYARKAAYLQIFSQAAYEQFLTKPVGDSGLKIED
jgi:hypothetical protein